MAIAAARGARRAFTLFETLVAMFILLIGLLGVVSTFSVGMQARLMAQELVVSSELAGMWSDWIRFRLNDSKSSGGLVLNSADLALGSKGDFFNDTGSFHLAPPGQLANLPTYNCNVYRNFTWEITAVNPRHKPQWLPEDSTKPVLDWDVKGDGSALLPAAVGAAPPALTEVELTVARGVRKYRFNYVFAGVGLKYDRMP